MVFYKLLIDNDPKQSWAWGQGVFDFVQPDKKTDKLYVVDVDVTEEAEALVKSQIKEVWEGIQAHKFEDGCGEETCKWCSFVKYNEIKIDTTSDDEEGEEIDDLAFEDPITD